MFARRQTFYDALFMVLNGRTEEHFMTFILRWLFNTLMNFTVGLSVAAVAFVFKLPGLLWSYGASAASGLAFFTVAALAGISVVVSYLGLLWTAGAGGAYFAVRAASNAARLEAGRAAARQQAIRGGRTHYD